MNLDNLERAESHETAGSKEIPIAKKTHRKRKRAPLRKRRPQTLGAAPGSIIPPPGVPRPVIRVLAYDSATVEEYSVGHVSDLKAVRYDERVTWINIDGLGDSDTFAQLGELFGLHPLAMEDVVNVHQRPKLEDYVGIDFIVMRMPSLIPHLDLEQVSMFVGERFVITIQEKTGDCFDGLRERIRHDKGRVRRRGSDYLAYSVLDAVVERFYPVVEHYADRLEEVETRVLLNLTEDVVPEIHAIQHELRALRRAILPTRDVVSAMSRSETGTARDDTRVFLRDCYDHTAQLLEILDTNRELASSLTDLHLSNLSMRMNEVMKVLTIIATIFIPLGFIAGLYGMNFETNASPWNMPELGWRYGYPFALGLMAFTAAGLVLFFRKKGWLRQGQDPKAVNQSEPGSTHRQ
jgi:magnesium transporter